MLCEMGQYQDELASCERVLHLDPRHALAWYNMGGALLSLGRERDALDAYRRASELGEDDARRWVEVPEQAAEWGTKVSLPDLAARKLA